MSLDSNVMVPRRRVIEMWEAPEPVPDPLFAAAVERILEVQFVEWVRELDMPHVVVCSDPVTGTVSLQGPYPTALAAACAAQRDQDREDEQPEVEHRMVFSVAPLLAPDNLSDSEDTAAAS
jgi:hypothetical protein